MGDQPCRIEAKFTAGDKFRASLGGKTVDEGASMTKFLPAQGPPGDDGSSSD